MAILHQLGDSAIVITLGQSIDLDTHHKVKLLAANLDAHPFHGMVEYVPAFTTVTVYFDPMSVYLSHSREQGQQYSPYDMVSKIVQGMLAVLEETGEYKQRTVEIPVCYDGDFGPDLEFVAMNNGLSKEEVIEIHSSSEYLVYMIGFAPGFPYLGGMSPRIAAPRHQTPRLSIPAGSVGIAGMQTGVYPIETPGGWQLIGRTPIALFRPQEQQPSLLQAGDTIRFRPITPEEYEEWKETKL